MNESTIDRVDPLLWVDDMLALLGGRYTEHWLKRRLRDSEYADRRRYLGRDLVMRRSDFEAFVQSIATRRTSGRRMP